MLGIPWYSRCWDVFLTRSRIHFLTFVNIAVELFINNMTGQEGIPPPTPANREVLLARAHYLLVYMPRGSAISRISGSARTWTLFSILKLFRNSMNISLYKVKLFLAPWFLIICWLSLWSISESCNKKAQNVRRQIFRPRPIELK